MADCEHPILFILSKPISTPLAKNSSPRSYFLFSNLRCTHTPHHWCLKHAIISPPFAACWHARLDFPHSLAPPHPTPSIKIFQWRSQSSRTLVTRCVRPVHSTFSNASQSPNTCSLWPKILCFLLTIIVLSVFLSVAALVHHSSSNRLCSAMQLL